MKEKMRNVVDKFKNTLIVTSAASLHCYACLKDNVFRMRIDQFNAKIRRDFEENKQTMPT